jgi:chemotaxis protein MotB
MKDKPTEWVAISDLMAGVVAVIVLLLIVSVLKTRLRRLKEKRERTRSCCKAEKIKTMLEEMKQSLKQGASGLASFDLENGKIIS